MNQLTELKPTDLIAAVVPEKSRNFIIDNEYGYIKYVQTIENLGHMQRTAFSQTEFPLEIKGEFEIIGEITKAGAFSFDASGYVGRDSWGEFIGWKKYTDKGVKLCVDANESFMSLLQANGIYLENPHGKDEDDYVLKNLRRFMNEKEGYGDDNSIELSNEWQPYESKVLPENSKLLIIKKSKP